VKPRLLVVGGTGLIGRGLTSYLRARDPAVLVTSRSPGRLPGPFLRFDLAEPVWPALPNISVAVICAAITRQSECRRDPAATRHINVVQTLKLIRELIAAETFVVFLSTNLVFDGCQPRQKPDAPLSPRTEYGRQKAEVERALAQWPDRTAVIRLTKVFHPGLPLLQSWRQDLCSGRPVTAFSDYVCSPIDLRRVIPGIARVALGRLPGVWQFSGPADISYAELAQSVARQCGAAASCVRTVPAPPGFLEHLPAHTTLDAKRSRAGLNLDFPAPELVLTECLTLAESSRAGTDKDGSAV